MGMSRTIAGKSGNLFVFYTVSLTLHGKRRNIKASTYGKDRRDRGKRKAEDHISTYINVGAHKE